MHISVVLGNMVKFVIQLLLLIAVMIGYAFNGVDINVGLHLLYIPVLLMMMAGMGLGLGIISGPALVVPPHSGAGLRFRLHLHQ